MESGWEVNIARLIDKANETLAASAQSRPYDYVHINRRGWSGRNHGGASSSSSMGVSFASTSAPTTLQGDRSALYRYESEGWDRSSHGNRSQVPLPRSDGVSSNQPLALRSPSFSEPVEARMNDERINGMENRIKLEVQAAIQRDVGQRASLAERATETLRKRVDGLADEVYRLRDTVLELKTGSQSQRETLEKMQADGEYIKASVDASKQWREERDSWFTRVDDSLSSLAEEAQNLVLRTNNHQTVLDEDMATREDLAAAAKTAREATELAIASALAPVRENFLQEIGAVRRRLLVVEEDAKRPVVPPLTRAHVQSIARETASAEGQELWRKVETHMQEKISAQVRDTGIIDDDFITTFQRVETRLTEVEQRVGKPQFHPETQETRGASTEEVSQLRDTVSALQQRLEGVLLGMAETRKGSDQAAESEESKCPSGNLVAALDLDARIKRLEELEREHIPASLNASMASSAWVDNKVEEMDKRLLEVISDAALTAKRQIAAEGRLEEVSEQLCGHSLKLRCLDGLWRESGCPGHDKLEAENFECGESSKEGISSALNRSAKTRRKVPSRKNISSGITKLLKRFGTNNTSTGPNQRHDEVNAEVNHRVADRAQTQTMTVARPGDAETVTRPRSVPKDGSDVIEDASRVDETVGSAGWVEGSEEIDVDHEALEKDTVSLNMNEKTNTVEANQFGKIASQGLSAACKDKSTPNGNQPHDGDGDGVGNLSCPIDSAGGIHEDQRMHPVGSDPAQGASEPEAPGACKRDRHGEESKQPRQGEDREAVANSEVPLDSFPSAAPLASTIKVPVASEGDRGRDAREGDFEDSGSAEGSVHSRWSLPDTGLRDPRRLLEQRAIWVGSRDEEDSVGTLDQALSSECEELRSDGRSSRSRVESYDLPRDVGDGYTLPFLSGVGLAEGELPTSEIETLSGSQGTITRKTSEDSEALGYDVESGRALSPNSAARVASTKVPAAPVGDGGPSSPAFASVKDFCCSDGEDDSLTGRQSTTYLGENTETKTCREKGGDGRGDEKEEPVRGFCLYDHDCFDEVGGDTEKTPKRRLKGDMTLLDRFPGLRNRDGVEGGGIDTILDYPRPDRGTRTAPDLGFSSEEDEDRSDLNLSQSDISSLREAEDTGEDVTPRRPQSSSPPPKSVSGFDSSSNDLS